MKTLFLILILTFAAFGQTTDCAANLQVSEQRLEKTLNDLDKSDAEKHTLETQLDTFRQLVTAKDALHEADAERLKAKDAELDVLRKIKCSESALLKLPFLKLFYKKTCY